MHDVFPKRRCEEKTTLRRSGCPRPSNLNLDVWVSSGGQTVLCADIWWQEVIAGPTGHMVGSAYIVQQQ